jgi:hypothetical protein
MQTRLAAEALSLVLHPTAAKYADAARDGPRWWDSSAAIDCIVPSLTTLLRSLPREPHADAGSDVRALQGGRAIFVAVFLIAFAVLAILYCRYLNKALICMHSATCSMMPSVRKVFRVAFRRCMLL